MIMFLIGVCFTPVLWIKPHEDRMANAEEICRAHAGAVLKRKLPLERRTLIPMGNRDWCSVDHLKAHDVADQIKAALTAKP